MKEEEILELLEEYWSITTKIAEKVKNPFVMMTIMQLEMTKFFNKIHQMGYVLGFTEGVKKRKEEIKLTKLN